MYAGLANITQILANMLVFLANMYASLANIPVILANMLATYVFWIGCKAVYVCRNL